MATNNNESSPWMDVARAEIGVKERFGDDDNPRIVEYQATTTLNANSDEVPWCASFLGWVLKQSGYRHTRSAAARSYLGYGKKVECQYAAIAVLRRGEGGHVAFVVEFDDQHVHLLGGNQNNEVNISKYSRERVIDFRMPTDEDKIN